MSNLNPTLAQVNAGGSGRVLIRTRGGGQGPIWPLVEVRNDPGSFAKGRFLTGSDLLLFVLLRNELVEPSSTVPASEDLHMEDRVQNDVPQSTFGIPDVNGKALWAADVFAGTVLLHWDRLVV
jgi:hypothetical protein